MTAHSYQNEIAQFYILSSISQYIYIYIYTVCFTTLSLKWFHLSLIHNKHPLHDFKTYFKHIQSHINRALC